MIANSKATLLAALLIPGAVFAQINVGESLGTTETAIRAAVEAQGYTVTEFETEDGEIEVEATLGEKSYEFEISPETGLVLAAYEEDEDEDDDDDDQDEDASDDDDDEDENDTSDDDEDENDD